MDTKQIGSFLKQLRTEHSMTQEQLGEKVGVSNKTGSRWETGNYMPPVECLSMLSDIYHISINEILAGKRVYGEGFAQIADQNLTATLQDLEKEHRVFEKRMMWVLAVATLLAMLIMILLPMESWKDIVVLILVWALALIANTVIIVALAAKNPKKDTDVDEDE